MKKRIIVIGGGFLQVPIIEAACSMDLHVTVFDMSKDAPGMKIAHETVLMSTRDIDGCVREAKRIHEIRPFHGVVTAGTDASRAVAAIAGALELPGIRYADAEAASNKVLMRKRLSSANVPGPNFYSVWSLKEARDAMDRLNFPLVLKPADNMGARGVIKIRNREEMNAAFRHSKKYSPTGEMILEEFMDGPELSVDALAFNGQIVMTGIADRIIEREPYFIERGHNMPSALDSEILKEAEEVMKAGMKALGIHTGAGKGDLKITKDGVKVGEIAARLSGGFMSSHTYPLSSGVNLLRAAIQISIGETPDGLEPVKNLVSIERSLIGSPGKILSIGGQEKMKAVNFVNDVFITRKPGDVILEPTSNIDKCGHVIITAPTLKEAEKSFLEAESYFELTVDDTFSVDWKKVEEKARNRFGNTVCYVCKICDGENCASGIPGMGGVGSMNTFRDNSRALSEIKILPRYIREPVKPDSTFEFLGRKFEHSIMIAPMTGAATNMNEALSEKELAQILLLGAREAGSIAFVGDGASPDRYKIILEALEEAEGFGIFVCKPREDHSQIIKRFKKAEERSVLAVGMDIDAISLKTLEMKSISGSSKTYDDLRRLRDATSLPFILKGILTPEDADLALKAGVDAVIVSNHGGRILDDMPGSARVLPEISDFINRKIPVFVDGGIRSGMDAFKMHALGADAVLTGRPMAIAAVGGGIPAVKYLLSRYESELRKAMNLCGTPQVSSISRKNIMHTVPDALKDIHKKENKLKE
ncbi:MAG: alpha-hydroxy-acid oxidizing protein [Spirochaetia bacterium]|nr:alpha-hydroxy-acid oxidizing protein [Spirochaetia bacterium]